MYFKRFYKYAMVRKNLFEPIVVKEIELKDEVFEVQPTAQLTIIYVHEGKGSSVYDTQEVPFKKGKLFVIPFDTKYVFKSKSCSLLLIECPPSFITQIRTEADRIETCDNINKLTFITHNYHSKAGCVFRDKTDELFASTLLQSIKREYQTNTQDYLIIRQCVSILLNLVARNLIQSDHKQVADNSTAQDVMKIITYIQQHIGDKQSLSIDALATAFGISKNYFGEYFKKQVGVSLQDYILDYKLKLVETRLKYSTMRLKEIAFELDFNDESHLSKLFKKYKLMTPSQYREKFRG